MCDLRAVPSGVVKLGRDRFPLGFCGRPEAAEEFCLTPKFNLDDIPPAPRGVPQIEVSFDIDANGILHVSAKDLGTGKEQKITITASSGLSKDEVEKMRKDAELHADEDKAKKEEIETRNEADNTVYRVEKMLKDAGDKVPAAEKAKVEAAITEVKEALKGSDAAAIKAASEKLQAASAEIYAAAAAAAQGKGAPGAAPGAQPQGEAPQSEEKKKDDGVIDAEVVDEKKK